MEKKETKGKIETSVIEAETVILKSKTGKKIALTYELIDYINKHLCKEGK